MFGSARTHGSGGPSTTGRAGPDEGLRPSPGIAGPRVPLDYEPRWHLDFQSRSGPTVGTFLTRSTPELTQLSSGAHGRVNKNQVLKVICLFYLHEGSFLTMVTQGSGEPDLQVTPPQVRESGPAAPHATPTWGRPGADASCRTHTWEQGSAGPASLPGRKRGDVLWPE